MAYNFPNSPTEGQEYTPPSGGQTYVWTSGRWEVKGTPPVASGVVIGNEAVSLAPSGTANHNYSTGVMHEKNVHSIINIAPTTSTVITGIDTSGWNGSKMITVRNNTSRISSDARAIILPRNSSLSTFANRFQYPGSKRLPLILMPEETADFYFNGNDLRLLRSSRPLNMSGYFDYVLTGIFSGGSYNTGTGASSSYEATASDSNSEPYIYLNLTTGTTATGRVALIDNSATHRAGAGALLSLSRVNVPILSTASEEFEVHVGFTENNALPSDEMCWMYKRTSGTSWFARTASNASGTSNTVTGMVVNTSDTPILGIFANGDGTRVEFFYSNDGGNAWSVFDTAITTTIPNTTSRLFGFGSVIIKTVGTTARDFRMAFNGVIGWT